MKLLMMVLFQLIFVKKSICTPNSRLWIYVQEVWFSGLSAFNPCERRMAPLSRDLSGIILPHDTYDNNLDSGGKTTYMLQQTILVRYGIQHQLNTVQLNVSVYKKRSEYFPEDPGTAFVARHVKQACYSLQISKCEIPTCFLVLNRKLSRNSEWRPY